MRTKDPVTRILWAAGVTLLISALILVWRSGSVLSKTSSDNLTDNPSAAVPKQVQIDLDKAIVVTLSGSAGGLQPARFNTVDGKSGWVVKIPGDRPIATPAYSDGMLFLGGGYGSHEFYAINAETGAVVWQIKTSDDGPTAAVVQDGCVAFNTESCTVVTCDAKTGKVLWQEWLGDPLMSQPAIYKGKLYIAHPAGQRRATVNSSQSAAQGGSGRATDHRLLCADLKTGKHIWDQPIPTDVITAPVIDGE